MINLLKQQIIHSIYSYRNKYNSLKTSQFKPKRYRKLLYYRITKIIVKIFLKILYLMQA